MVDRYTKVVLTAIAASLAAIALQGAVRPAGAQMSAGCGSMISGQQPCSVTWSQAMPVKVSPY